MNFIEKIKSLAKNKGFLIVLSASLLLVYVFINDSQSLRTTSPISVTQDPIVTTAKPERTVSLVSVEPPSGSVRTFDSFQPIELKFSGPIDPASVDIAIVPRLEFNARVSEKDATTLFILPRKGWDIGTKYNILLRSLSTTDGAVLDKPYAHTYENTPPDPEKVIFPF